MLYIYTTITRALKATHTHLIKNSNNFRALIKAIKTKLRAKVDIAARTAIPDNSVSNSPKPHNLGKPAQHNKLLWYQSFSASKTVKQVHHTQTGFQTIKAMQHVIKVGYKALSSNWIDMCQPLNHLVHRNPSGVGYINSCLHAVGGYILNIGF